MDSARKWKVVVCDNGTGFLKAGRAGQTYPEVHVPCLVGRPAITAKQAISRAELPPLLVGDGCVEHEHQLQLSHPIENGVVKKWHDMRCLWDHAFYDLLEIEPGESRIMLTDPPTNTHTNRMLLLETMFETYGFAGVYMQAQAVLSLYSQGLMTGVVVDSGSCLTHVVPVVDGYTEAAHAKRINVAGDHVTQHLLHLLKRRGYTMNGAHDLQAVRRLKERSCYVALDYQRERQVARDTTCLAEEYTLPDGQVVRLAQERFQAAEALFQPAVMDLEEPGIAETVHRCIHDLPMDSRLRMYRAVLLSGGTTMLPGVSTRLERDLRQLYLDNVLKGRVEGMSKLKLRVEDPPMRRHMVFVGASILAEIMADFDDFWISKAEFEEDPHRALSKCSSLSGAFA